MEREEGGVEVDAAEPWEIEDVLGEDLAVGDDDHEIGIEGRDEVVGEAKFLGLVDGDSVGEGERFGGWRREDLFTADGFIGLADDGDDLDVFEGEEGGERGDADVAGAGEDDAHGWGG